MTIGDDKDYIKVLLYSYYATITGWGVLLTNHKHLHLADVQVPAKQDHIMAVAFTIKHFRGMGGLSFEGKAKELKFPIFKPLNP